MGYVRWGIREEGGKLRLLSHKIACCILSDLFNVSNLKVEITYEMIT
jgi:hypothetical protein